MKNNQLASILYVVAALGLSACSSHQQNTSYSPPPDSSADSHIPAAEPVVRSGSRGGLSSILSAHDEGDEEVVNPNAPYSADANTVWPRIRGGYRFDAGVSNAAIDKELKWYRNNPAYLYRATERSKRYLHYIVSAVQQRNMPTEMALLPIVESAYDPFVYSRSGAAGLWQFVPDTGRLFGLKQNWWYDGRKDVVASTEAALNYLQYLHNKFGGDWLLAVAAYNCGEGAIARAIDANRRAGRRTDFWSLELREETRLYVPRLLALTKIVQAPHAHGISLYNVPNKAYFAAVETGGQLDLAKAAAMAQVDVDEVYRLNPGYHHWATDPNGPQRLLLPVAAVDRFTQQLAVLPAGERVTWARYDVKKGDTLMSIARQFDTDKTRLVQINNLASTALRPGQTLMIPRGEVRDNSKLAHTAPKPAPVRPLGSKQVFHTVQSGENLLRISQRYGVGMDDVRRWNGMSADSTVRLGQKLSIWSGGKTEAVAKVTAARKEATPSTQKVGYTVRSGDSLHAIASKFNVQVNDIVRWNQVSPRALLQPGQHLTLFLDAAVAGR